MPQYDYICHACNKPFAKTLTLSEYDKGKVTCPKCRSRRVEQQVSSFCAATTKRSA